jgi:hypothetical protein
VAVALDESAEAIAPFAEGITIPVLIDRDHLLSELLAISNVPTVIWVDEHDRIVRPNAAEFGTDTFSEITGIKSQDHMDLVRAWVRDGTVPELPADFTVPDLDLDEIRARLHYRAAVHLRRNDDAASAERHFQAAVGLAPLDFTISRAAMPLRGKDPFGEEFMGMLQEWVEQGAPYHGLPRPPRPDLPS